MLSDTVFAAIHDFLAASWSATPLVFENEDFQKPSPPSPWVLAEVSGTSYAQASIGAKTVATNLWREEGLLWMHVMVPAATGSLAARQYAKQLADLFRGRELLAGLLTFREIAIGHGGPWR